MLSEALISVSGMTCGACSASITEALESIEAVHSAAVSLITNEAKVLFSDPATPEQLVAAVEDCGFDAKVLAVKRSSSLTTVLDISGMTCGACSSSITEALEKVPGVTLASVSLLTNSAKIVHDSSVSSESLCETVEDCGFDATVSSTNSGVAAVTTKLTVTGMTCGACLASITEALEKVAGVISANVSHITDTASVVHNADVPASTIKETIEDCGFTATLALSASSTNDEEHLILQIYGMDDNTDVTAFQYNVEAVLSGLPGVHDFQFVFKGQVDAEFLENSTGDLDPENLIDELRVELSTNLTGVRQLVDALNGIDTQHEFFILNSVDQSLTSQLKLLSKTKDIQYWKANFLHSLAFGVPILLLSLTERTHLWKSLILFHGLFLVSVLELALATHILFNLGSVFFKKFGVFIRNKGRGANMDVLVCISTLVAYGFSIVSIGLSVWWGQTERPPKVLFETTAMLVCFVSFGKWIENRAKGATSTALTRLMSLTPTTCVIVTDVAEFGELVSATKEKEKSMTDLHTRTIPIDLIQNDDIAVVTPGSKVPADGKIVYGSTEIDESILTGESLPVPKKVGDLVIGGSINGPFLFYVKVSGAGKHSQLHQIIEIVKESQVNKAPVQRFADFVAARFVMFVLLLSLATFIFWCLMCVICHPDKLPKMFSKEENGKYFVCLKLAISVIVVACPCALGLAAPTAVMVGTGVGASHGALIKGGDILEKASKIKIILFDKTGTLTSGEMHVVRAKTITEAAKVTPKLWWTLVGSVEVNSEHPAGKSLVKHAKKVLGMSFEEDTFDTFIADFEVVTGMGVRATITAEGASYNVAVGNRKMIVKEFPNARQNLANVLETDLVSSVYSVSHVVINGEYCGYLELSDTIKKSAKYVIDYLQYVENYQIGILTGDTKEVAESVGSELGVPLGNIFSEISPLDKDKVISKLRQRFGGEDNVSIAFVGDGINDAPALVQADIGMAISSGTDIAIDSAEVVLMGLSEGSTSDLFGLVTALQVSAASFRKIKWNFFCATIYNVFMLPFAMGCFLPFNVMLSPPAAAAAMACSSISVVLNSLTLKNWTPPNIKELLRSGNFEKETGSSFSLKHSSLEDFNYVKRARLVRKGRFGSIMSIFEAKRNTTSYELLPSTSS